MKKSLAVIAAVAAWARKSAATTMDLCHPEFVPQLDDRTLFISVAVPVAPD